jgi:predicted enzyme related to lactoylglutathione lyase
MTLPVTYAEIHSPDLAQSRAFMTEVFAWSFEPCSPPRPYLVAEGATSAIRRESALCPLAS